MQIIFQDPYESMNPRMDVQTIISEPLVLQGLTKSVHDSRDAVASALADVEMVPPEEYMGRYPMSCRVDSVRGWPSHVPSVWIRTS